MKKVRAILVACLAAFPLSVFAADTTGTEVVIESGVASMMCADPCH